MDGLTITNDNSRPKEKRKGMYGSTLKLIAIITMLIDHTAAVIIERILSSRGFYNASNDVQALQDFYVQNASLVIVNMAMRLIGRIAFPIFCFLLVEGFVHTRNKGKYAIRLALFALISEIPFDLAFKGKVLEFGYQNIFFTLLVGLLVMIGFHMISEKLRNQKWLPALAIVGAVAVGYALTKTFTGIIQFFYNVLSQMGNNTISSVTGDTTIRLTVAFSVIALIVYGIMIKKRSLQVASVRFADLAILIAGMSLADFLKTDYSGFGVLTIAVVYGLRKNPFKSMLGGCITLTIMSLLEFTCFLALIPARMYNGLRGLKLRIVFYAFYPVHLLVLYLICYLMKIV